jgi:enoyl-CoA hydratase/carnithine racemase
MLQILHHGPIHEIRLARPPANALNSELLVQLRDAVQAAPGNGAQGLILSSGPGFFSGGMDVPVLMSLDKPALVAAWQHFFAAVRALAKSPVPVVAAIGGHAPAGGCVLALCCDYRIMALGPSRIGLNETQVGLAVPDAIQQLMRRVVGIYRAERLIIAGAMIDSETAERIGLVDELTDSEHVAVRALHWLEELLKLPRAPMLASRAIARADMVKALDDFTDADLGKFLEQWDSPDTQAAMTSLMARLKK